jgi:hypothetical protein
MKLIHLKGTFKSFARIVDAGHASLQYCKATNICPGKLFAISPQQFLVGIEPAFTRGLLDEHELGRV